MPVLTTIIAAGSLAVGVGTTVAQRNAEKRRASAQREASAVSSANEDIKNRLARRRAAREERIRRSRLVAGAATSGTAGSSAALGASSALGANFGSSVAAQQSDILAARGITAANQRAAGAESSYFKAGAYGKLAGQGLGFVDTVFNS